LVFGRFYSDSSSSREVVIDYWAIIVSPRRAVNRARRKKSFVLIRGMLRNHSPRTHLDAVRKEKLKTDREKSVDS